MIRNSLPVQVNPQLKLAGETTTVTVEVAAESLENAPSPHVDVDRSQLAKLPSGDPGSGLSAQPIGLAPRMVVAHVGFVF